MKKLLTIAALATVVLAGCQKNEIAEVTQQDSQFVNFDAYAGKTTKAVLTTNTNFASFTVYGYQGATSIDWANPTGLMSDVDVIKNGTVWSSAAIKWPVATTQTQFFAYSPKTAVSVYSIANSMPQVVFTADADVAKQVDLVVAESAVTEAPVAGTSKSVALNFSHALSKVVAKVSVASSMKVYVESIEMGQLGSVGTYVFNPSAANDWNTIGTKTNYPISLVATAATTGITSASYTNITAVEGAALVIPQTTTAWGDVATDGIFSTTTKSYITITYKLQNNADNSYVVGSSTEFKTAYFPIAYSFLANKAYNLNIMFGSTGGGTGGGGFDDNGDPTIEASSLITFDVTFTDWDATEIDLPATL